MVKVSPNDPRPPFVQIADQIREAIDSGALEPGAKLASQRALSEEYGVAGMTMQHALRVLRDEGRLVSLQGRGVFVAEATDRRPQSASGSEELTRRLDELTEEVRQLRQRVDDLEQPISDM